MLGSAFAVNTHRTYSSAQNQFHHFCQHNNFLHANGSLCPTSELTLLHFLGRMSATCQASTVKVYLAAIRALHIMHGFQDPLTTQTRIPLVIRGLQSKKSIVQRPQKSPITALILHTHKVQLDLSKFEGIMLWAAFCTAFFGFLWAAEFTCQHNTFSPQDNLSVLSVSLDKHPVPDTVFIRIKKSKMDQFFKGCSIVLAHSDFASCPVAALMSYLRKRDGDSGPLFRFADRSPLTRDKLNSRL